MIGGSDYHPILYITLYAWWVHGGGGWAWAEEGEGRVEGAGAEWV